MKKFIISIFILFLSSCSLNFTGESSDNPEVREVLINLSSNYLINIVNGNFAEIDSIILWSEYRGNKDKSITRKKYFKQLSNLDGRYKIEDHPLLNLKPEDFDISENDATLSFIKKDSPEIELSFMWSGSAWQIVDDNLFGKDGLFTNLKPISEEEKRQVGKIRQKKLNALDLE